MKCPHCGENVRVSAKKPFCSVCGKKVLVETQKSIQSKPSTDGDSSLKIGTIKEGIGVCLLAYVNHIYNRVDYFWNYLFDEFLKAYPYGGHFGHAVGTGEPVFMVHPNVIKYLEYSRTVWIRENGLEIFGMSPMNVLFFTTLLGSALLFAGPKGAMRHGPLKKRWGAILFMTALFFAVSILFGLTS